MILLLSLLSMLSWANATATVTKTESAPVMPETPLMFFLSDLVPTSVSNYPTNLSTVRRHYFQFRNNDGSHYFVYEEDSGFAPIREVTELKRAMENWNSSCSVDLDCKEKPFCTGRCRNMYYQLSNRAGEGKDRCKIVSFTCTRSGELSPASQGR